MCLHLWHYHCSQDNEYIIPSPSFLMPFVILLLAHLNSIPQIAPKMLSVIRVFIFSRFLYKWNDIACTFWGVWLFHPSWLFWDSLIRYVAIVLSFSLLSSVPCTNILLYVYPFPCWWVFGLFPVSGCWK